MQRTIKKFNIAPSLVRYRILVTGEPCPAHTHESRQHLFMFLHWLADNQSLLECGYSVLDRLLITHNGTAWQAAAEAEVEEVTD